MGDHRRTAAAIVMAAGVMAVVVGGCSASGDPGQAAPPAQVPASNASASPSSAASSAASSSAAPAITDVSQLAQACPLLDGGQVGSRFGGGKVATGVEKPAQTTENGGKVARCDYEVEGSPVAVLAVTVGEGSTIPPQEMIAAIREKAGNGEPVDGVGAAALFHKQGEAAVFSSANTVGGTPVLVSVSGPGTEPLEKFQPLVEAVVARF